MTKQDDRALGLDPTERAWFAAIVDSSFDAIIGQSLEGEIISWNPAAERIYGFTALEALGCPSTMLAPEEGRAEILRLLAALKVEGAVQTLETVHLRRDGQPIEVALTLSPVKTPGGRLMGASMITRDISEAKRAARELVSSRERLSAALFASEIGIFRWDIAEDRLEWDDNLRRLFGLPPETRIERIGDFLGKIHPEDREELLSAVQQSIAERAPLAKEFRVRWPDGSIRWISDKARAFYDSEGRPLYLTGACRDVTARRRVAEELSAALEAKEALLQQKDLLLKEVNHRVKNSLQLVSSLLSLQGLGIDDSEVRSQFVEACNRVGAIARVHERLYKSENVRTVPFGTYLTEVCGDIASAVVPEGAAQSLVVQAADVDLEPDAAIPLALIVNELLTNALKYAYPTGPMGEIRVLVQPAGERSLRVAVEDDGIGLPQHVDPATSSSLGMKLVRALVKQIGARLEIRREPPGVGFHIRLDLPDRSRA